MNSSFSNSQAVFVEDLTTTTIDSWFIPFDIIIIVCTILVIIFATLFLSFIALDKTCHTVPIILIVNSCLVELVLACNMLAMGVFVLQNDLKQIQYQDSLCVFRSYFNYSALQNYSYLLSSIYRYVLIIYPTRLFWQSKRTQMLFIVISWIFAFVFAFPYLFTGDIIYDSDNQMCQVSLRFSFTIVYGTQCTYIIPLTMITFIYIKLVRYVKGMSKRVTPVNTLFRVQRNLKMIQRIVILVIIVTVIGFLYLIIIFLSYFNRAPRYHFRIGYMSTNVPIVFVMMALFNITDPLKSL